MFYFVQIAEKLKFIDESEDFSTIKHYTEPLSLSYVWILAMQTVCLGLNTNSVNNTIIFHLVCWDSKQLGQIII